jgi:hypothetical protein
MYAACPKSANGWAQGTLVVGSRNPKLSSTYMRSLSLLSSTSYRSIVFIRLASVSCSFRHEPRQLEHLLQHVQLVVSAAMP